MHFQLYSLFLWCSTFILLISRATFTEFEQNVAKVADLLDNYVKVSLGVQELQVFFFIAYHLFIFIMDKCCYFDQVSREHFKKVSYFLLELGGGHFPPPP